MKIDSNLTDLSNLIGAQIFKGEGDCLIDNISDLKSSNIKSIVFINDKAYLNLIASSKSITCLTSKDFLEYVKDFENILISENPYYSFSLLMNFFNEPNNPVFLSKCKNFTNKPSIGKGSHIDDSVSFGTNVKIGSNCVIEKDVYIGDDVVIDHNVVIYNSSTIGSNSKISSGSVIGSQGFGFAIDNSSNWVPITHIGSVKIGCNTYIGSNVTIDRGTLTDTIIGNNVIIDNGVHIAHNVFIDDNTAIAANSGIAGSTVIGKRCQIGGMVGIFGHLNVVDDVVITPKSNVFRDIKKPGRYTSIFPLVEHSSWKKISFLIRKIDKISNLILAKKS